MSNINFIGGLSTGALLLFVLLMIWSLFWKGLGLWYASKRDEKRWFIFILVLNTFGILEIIYLFHFVKVKWREIW